MGERSFGARWWRDSLSIARLAARPVAGTLSLYGALTLSGCAHTYDAQAPDDVTAESDARDDVALQVDALQLQMEEGWDVGQTGAALAFPGSTVDDIAGGQGWRTAMTNLAGTLAPSSAALQPFYVPTLFQSLIAPGGQRLRAVMRPIHTPEMDQDFARGLALRRQFASVAWPRDTALVVDAPGPRAIAVAAALADRFAPVFTFGNWPHPLGVVPAHQTLAAALFYLPVFTAAQSARAPDAPPVFVLDANRLLPYADGERQFDNRYFVRLPSAEQLAALGVKHVLYVSADGAQELDDLNAQFVALCQRGVDVKMVALGDFVRADDAPALADGDGDGDGGYGEGGDDEPSPDEAATWGWAAAIPLWLNPWFGAPPFWYRGCWWDPGLFWGDYGTYHPRPVHLPPRRGAVVIGPPAVHRVPPASHAVAWLPAARPNLFGGRAAPPGARIAAPPDFGQVAVRASRVDGHLTGVGARIAAPAPAGSSAGAHVWGGSNGVWHSSSGRIFGAPAGAFHGGNHVFVPSGSLHGGNHVFAPSGSFHGGGGRVIGAPSSGFGRSGSIGRAGGFGGFGGG